MMRTKVTLLGRPGCHLCEEFEFELLAHAGPGTLQIALEDVDSREDWKRRYGMKIPVLLADDGSLICATRVDVSAVDQLLRASRRNRILSGTPL